MEKMNLFGVILSSSMAVCGRGCEFNANEMRLFQMAEFCGGAGEKCVWLSPALISHCCESDGRESIHMCICNFR